MTETDPSHHKEVWLLQLSEPLPIDPGYRPMRTSDQAAAFMARGYKVRWFAGRFNHQNKTIRTERRVSISVSEGYSLELLKGGSYRGNLSLRRIIHHTLAALHFLWISIRLVRPALMVVSYPTPELAAAGALYCKFRKVPYVVDVRDAWPSIFKSYVSAQQRIFALPLIAWYALLYRIILSNSRGIFSSSSSMLLDASTYLKPQHQNLIRRTFFIGYANPKLEHAPIPSHFSEQSPLRVLFIGSFGFSYDIPYLLQIARAVEDHGQTHIEFLLVGDGECRYDWEARARELKLSSVKFLGWLGEVEIQSVLLTSHVGAMLLGGEMTKFTVPNKLGEYLSRGLVILSNLEGEVESLLSEYDAGRTCTPNSAELVAQWLINLSIEPSLMQKLQLGALRLFQEHFEKSVIYESMTSEIIELCLNDT